MHDQSPSQENFQWKLKTHEEVTETIFVWQSKREVHNDKYQQKSFHVMLEQFSDQLIPQ